MSDDEAGTFLIDRDPVKLLPFIGRHFMRSYTEASDNRLKWVAATNARQRAMPGTLQGSAFKFASRPIGICAMRSRSAATASKDLSASNTAPT